MFQDKKKVEKAMIEDTKGMLPLAFRSSQTVFVKDPDHPAENLTGEMIAVEESGDDYNAYVAVDNGQIVQCHYGSWSYSFMCVEASFHEIPDITMYAAEITWAQLSDLPKSTPIPAP